MLRLLVIVKITTYDLILDRLLVGPLSQACLSASLAQTSSYTTADCG